MHAACVVAEYDSLDDVKVAVEVLRKNDFHADAISFVWKGHERALEKVQRKTFGGESLDERLADEERSMGIGALIGAIPGIQLGITTIMGPFMVAGPLAAVAGGAVVGGLLAEMGHLAAEGPSDLESVSDYDRINAKGLYAMAQYRSRHEHKASKYEERVLQGNILIIVTSTPPRLDEAERALQTTHLVSLQRFAIRHTEEGPKPAPVT